MHPLLNQQLAQQHRADLAREVELTQAVKLVRSAESTPRQINALHLLSRWYDSMSFLSRRPVVQSTTQLENVSLTEIRPALLTTFYTLHERGFVSNYDQQFIEEFVETFQGELAHQVECKCAKV